MIRCWVRLRRPAARGSLAWWLLALVAALAGGASEALALQAALGVADLAEPGGGASTGSWASPRLPRQASSKGEDAVTLISEAGGFAITFPGEPRRGELHTGPGVNGEFFTLRLAQQEFFVGYFTHPYVGLEKSILQKSVEQAAGLFGGEVTEIADVEHRGLRGKAFLLVDEGGRLVRGVHLVSGNAVFLLRYMAQGTDFDAARANAFLGSFQVLPQTALHAGQDAGIRPADPSLPAEADQPRR